MAVNNLKDAALRISVLERENTALKDENARIKATLGEPPTTAIRAAGSAKSAPAEKKATAAKE